MGSYVNGHLIKDEIVVYETKYHWVIFFSLKSIFTLTLYAWFKRWLAEFVITNRRIVIKEGFIARRTFEMNLSKIETVNVDQSVMGRILNRDSITSPVRWSSSGGSRNSANLYFLVLLPWQASTSLPSATLNAIAMAVFRILAICNA